MTRTACTEQWTSIRCPLFPRRLTLNGRAFECRRPITQYRTSRDVCRTQPFTPQSHFGEISDARGPQNGGRARGLVRARAIPHLGYDPMAGCIALRLGRAQSLQVRPGPLSMTRNVRKRAHQSEAREAWSARRAHRPLREARTFTGPRVARSLPSRGG